MQVLFCHYIGYTPINQSTKFKDWIPLYKFVKRDIENRLRQPGWQGKAEDILRGAPRLIPIYRHRYMPMIDDADAPVLSTIGQDTIWYEANLCDYLQREFLNYETGEEIKVSEQVAKRARPRSDIAAN